MSHIFSPGTAPFPGACLICGSSRRPCIDFPVTQPWNGAMLVCTECFFGMAIEHGELLNLTKRSDSDAALDTVQDVVRVLSKDQDNVRAAVGKLQEDIANAVNSFDNSVVRPGAEPVASDKLDKLLNF